MKENYSAFTLAEGRLASTNTQVSAKGGQVRTYTSKVSEVSRVSEVSNMSEQDEQQSLHSFAPWGEGRGEGSDKSALILGETASKSHKSICPPLEGGPKSPISRRGSVRSELLTPHQGRPACTNTLETAKEVLSTSSLAILSRKGRGMRAAFTLAEVLITLAIIGIVAAMTLPGLIQNHNEKAWSTAKDLWEKKLTETVRRMNIDGVMTGHDTTEDFMNTFKNYMKVIKTCDNNDINKCYAPKVVRTGSESEPEEIQTSDLKTAENLGNDWGTNTMSFVVADGTTAIFAYNPNCAYADPIEDTGSQVSCLAYMVDVNGKKGPNRVTQDIALVGQIALSNCDNPIGDMCWSTDFAPTAINTCSDGTEEDKTYDPTGDSNSYCITNYWAGAKKACQNMGMTLPARAQLAQLASELYVSGSGEAVTVASGSSVYPLVLKPKYATDPPITIGRSYWSSSQYNVNEAYTRQFTSTGTYAAGCDYPKNQSHRRAVCLGS